MHTQNIVSRATPTSKTLLGSGCGPRDYTKYVITILIIYIYSYVYSSVSDGVCCSDPATCTCLYLLCVPICMHEGKGDEVNGFYFR